MLPHGAIACSLCRESIAEYFSEAQTSLQLCADCYASYPLKGILFHIPWVDYGEGNWFDEKPDAVSWEGPLG